MRKIGTGASVVMLAAFIVLIEWNSCVPVWSRSSLIGTYELSGDHQKIVVDMARDGTFSEMVEFRDGKQQKLSGTWKWKDREVRFDNLWIPPSFAPDYIVKADAESAPHQGKFTEPGSWSIPPTYRWATVVLEPFPDDGVELRKVK